MPENSKIFDRSDDPQIPNEIEFNSPVCYAYNKHQGTSGVGTFTALKSEGKYYAISCFHVFASQDDLIDAHGNLNHVPVHKTVVFVVGNREFEGTIDRYEFNNSGGNGVDYCRCEISESLYAAYVEAIDQSKLVPIDDRTMVSFGASTKFELNFKKGMSSRPCDVNYEVFTKRLNLYRIVPTNENAVKGDSGAIVRYRIPNVNKIFKGMLVSRAEGFSYIFRLTNDQILT